MENKVFFFVDEMILNIENTKIQTEIVITGKSNEFKKISACKLSWNSVSNNELFLNIKQNTYSLKRAYINEIGNK